VTTIASQCIAAFSALLSEVGVNAVRYARATTQSYDSAQRVVDTSTQWATGTTATCVHQPAAEGEAQYGDKGVDANGKGNMWFRHTVTVNEGDKVTVDGTTYIVRMSQQSRHGYRKVEGQTAEGQKVDGDV
jgi:hypothetical protein